MVGASLLFIRAFTADPYRYLAQSGTHWILTIKKFNTMSGKRNLPKRQNSMISIFFWRSKILFLEKIFASSFLLQFWFPLRREVLTWTKMTTSKSSPKTKCWLVKKIEIIEFCHFWEILNFRFPDICIQRVWWSSGPKIQSRAGSSIMAIYHGTKWTRGIQGIEPNRLRIRIVF